MTRTAILGSVAPLAIAMVALGSQAAYAQARPADAPATDTKAATGKELASDEIIVTARFRSEAAQSIGAPITPISAAAIERQGIVDFSDIARSTPGLASADRGPNQNEVLLRGISNQVGDANADGGNAGPLVSQSIDDVPVATANGSQKDFNLFDFERIEVLRGPQPTLYGEGAVGGSIRYVTADPKLTGGAIADVVVQSGISGTANGGANFTGNAAATVNLVPGVFGVRGVFNFRRDDGFINNPVRNVNGTNPYRSIGGRFVALLKPSDQFSVRLSGILARDTTRDSAFIDVGSDPKSLQFSAPVGAQQTDDVDLLSLRVQYDTGPITLTSVSGYYRRDRQAGGYDAGNSGGFSAILGTPINLNNNFLTRDRTYSQELRLASNFDGAFNFIGALFYRRKTSDVTLSLQSPDGSFSPFLADPTGPIFDNFTTYRTRQYSGFLEGTLKLDDRVRLVAGARYVNEEIKARINNYTSIAGFAPPIPVLDFASFLGLFGLPREYAFKLSRVLPKASIEFDVARDVLAYGVVSEGVRNGNITTIVSAFQAAGGGTAAFDGTRFADLVTFDADNVWNYEVGLKTRTFDGKLTVNVALYISDYRNPQIVSAVPFLLTTNGPDARVKGAELETIFRPGGPVSFYGNIAYTDAKFRSSALTVPTLAPTITADVLKGNTLANVPEVTFNVGANLDQPILGGKASLIGNVNYNYIGPRYSTAQNFVSTRLPSIGLVNLRLGVEYKGWKLTAFATNLFNQIKAQSINAITGFAFATPSGRLDAPVSNIAINRPRVVGADLTVRF